jgi:hypothetical protein
MSERSRPGKGSRPGSARDREAAARRHRRLKIFGFVMAGLILLVGLELLLHRPNSQEKALLSAAPALARGAGCGPVQTIPPFPGDRDRTHIGGSDAPIMPPLSAYRSIPPVSGPHDPVPLHAGIYATSPPIDQAIHSLEHAGVIIWLDPSVATADDTRTHELDRIRQFFAQGNERDHVIVAPYNYPAEGAAGHLPAGKSMALAAWHHLQICTGVDLAVAYAFVATYRMDIYRFWEYRGDAPERWFAPI